MDSLIVAGEKEDEKRGCWCGSTMDSGYSMVSDPGLSHMAMDARAFCGGISHGHHFVTTVNVFPVVDRAANGIGGHSHTPIASRRGSNLERTEAT